MLLIWLQRALFSALPPGLYLIYPNRRCLCFPPCNHSYINNSKYFSDCSASFSSSCLFSACSPAKTTNWTRVGCGWGQRQAAAVCSFPLFFVFLFSLSLGKIQGMDHCWFHHDAERTDITFQTMTALWSLTGSAKVWCYHQTRLSSQSLQLTAAGSRSFDSQILYVISVGPSF